jgi:T4 RnlA family RNA ligase
VLTAIRDIKTGGYAPYDRLVSLAKSYGVPVIRQWDFAMVEQWHNTVQRGNKTMSSFVNFVRDLEDLEGFVVRFDDGHMLKLKCDWYVQIHKAKEKILQDRNIVELILDNNLDDVKAHLPQEDRDRLTQFESDFNKAVTDTVAYIVQILYYIDKAGVDRKSYAINHAPNVNGYVRPIVFKNFDTPFDMNLAIKILDDVRNTIRNNLTKTVKYEEIRDVWFKGVTYNES